MRDYDDNPHLPSGELKAPQPNAALTFYKESTAVATLDFNGPVMVFTGEADTAAQVFLDALGNLFAARLAEEYQKGLRDAAKC